MPTADRPAFAARAIGYFLRQDYPRKELIVVDDGQHAIAAVLPEDPAIRYIRLEPRSSVGAKRNIACASAAGDFIAHWDDDDWHAPHRLCLQVQELERREAAMCGITTLLFYDCLRGRGWQYSYPHVTDAWVAGSTLFYRRDLWDGNRFRDQDVAEDAHFVAAAGRARIAVLSDFTFHVGLIHDGNVSPKQPGGPWWRAYPLEQLERLLGADAREFLSHRQNPGH